VRVYKRFPLRLPPKRGNAWPLMKFASGAPALLLEHYAGRLEDHTPWSIGREVSHLFRGIVDLAEANAVLADGGFGWLRLVDNGIVHEPVEVERMPGLATMRAYHLIPAAASKARAVCRHMQARGYATAECIAVGDPREEMDTRAVVGAFWLVANARERGPTPEAEAGRLGDVRVASPPYGDGGS